MVSFTGRPVCELEAADQLAWLHECSLRGAQLGDVGIQVDDTEDSTRASVTNQVNPGPIPVIVEVPPLKGI
jgi:hypothetical protein